MWLLNTARAELEFFPTSESVPRGYAILSHVWGEDEQTFQDLQALRARCAASGDNPRDSASPKIRNFCILAERGGYEWGWVDTCCIDKTSSAELTEAINSMYRYYSLADVCYVYLRDVPTGPVGVLGQPESAFRMSIWHRRGWTLQELIAPDLVVLLSQTWEPLGTKADLAPLLQEITRVPVDVLRLEAAPGDYCIAARMAWAARRETTRPEDTAYCLMGIFGIFMPALYGEGKNAFRRLQEEIVKQSEDASIFAWGDTWPIPPASASRIPEGGLFAPSPFFFIRGNEIQIEKNKTLGERKLWYRLKRQKPLQRKRLTFDITPYGVLINAPVFTAVSSSGTQYLIAVLVGIQLGSAPSNIGVFLKRAESPDPARPLYTILHWHGPDVYGRLVRLDEDCRHGLDAMRISRHGAIKWQSIYVAHQFVLPAEILTRPRPNMSSRGLHAPFHIPRWHLMELLAHPHVGSTTLTLSIEDVGFPWTGNPPLSLHFSFFPHGMTVLPTFAVLVRLGLCSRIAHGDAPVHWATAVAVQCANTELPDHLCSEHHVNNWPDLARTFTFESTNLQRRRRLAIRMFFSPSSLNPTQTRNVQFGFEIVPVGQEESVSR